MDYITFIDFYKSLSLKEKRIIQNIQRCIDDHDAKINIQELFSKDDDWISLTEKYEIINGKSKMSIEKEKKLNYFEESWANKFQ